jgi:hypothetical protein
MDPNRNRQQPADTPRYPPCVACGTPLEPLMHMPVRVGGADAGFVFFRGFKELEERILTLDMYRCPRCRRLEFYDLDMSLPNK